MISTSRLDSGRLVPASSRINRKRGSSGGRIVQVFLNADMRQGHSGLKKLAESYGIYPELFERGEYLVFINRQQKMLKVMAGKDLIAFYKSPSGRLTMESIQYIPEAFLSDGNFEMGLAIKRALTQAFERRLH